MGVNPLTAGVAADSRFSCEDEFVVDETLVINCGGDGVAFAVPSFCQAKEGLST